MYRFEILSNSRVGVWTIDGQFRGAMTLDQARIAGYIGLA